MIPINTSGAPAAIGPYCHAVKVGNLLFTSGQIPLDLAGDMPSGIEAQTEQVFDNLAAVLAEAGSSLDRVVKATVFVTDLGDFAKLNAVYEKRFGGHKRVPVFDTASLRQYYTAPARRLFAVEHLASYTRVQSGPVWVRHGERWRRQRFSELEPHRLAALLELVAEEERPGIYRRLGDLALFLTGVFPDHSATRPLLPIESERLIRTLTLAPTTPMTPAEAAEVIASAGRGRQALLGVLGPRWYRQAAAVTPLPTTRALLLDAAEGFDLARRFLNLVTDRYLFPLRDGFFGAAAS